MKIKSALIVATIALAGCQGKDIPKVDDQKAVCEQALEWAVLQNPGYVSELGLQNGNFEASVTEAIYRSTEEDIKFGIFYSRVTDQPDKHGCLGSIEINDKRGAYMSFQVTEGTAYTTDDGSIIWKDFKF